MADNAVGIDIVARLDGLRAELAKIPDIGGKAARELTGVLAKEIRNTEKAAREAANASKSAKVGFDAMGRAAGDAGSGMAKAAGAADMLHPALGSVFRGGADVADVFEVVGGAGAVAGAAMAAAAVVALELVAAYAVLTGAEREAARVSAEVAVAREALAPITRSLRDATVDLDEATGKLTATQAENLRSSIAAYEQLQEATEGTRQRLGELAVQQGSVWTQMVDGVESVVPSWTPLGYAIRAVTTDSGDLQVEQTALNGVLTEARDKTRALVTTEHARAESLAKTSAAAREAAVAQMSVEDQVLELRERVAQREADRQRAMRDANNEDLLEKEARDRKSEEEITATHTREAAKRQAIAELEAAQAIEVRQRTEDAVVSILGSSADAAYTISQRIGKDNEEAALAAFYVSQGAAAAEAAINTVLAMSEASTLPYPANIPATIAAGAVGAAQEIAILSTPAPTFSDTPGVQQVPMGGMLGFGAGDYVAAARDPEDLRRQVDQMAPSSSGPNVSLIGRRMYGSQLRDATEWNSPMVQAIAGTRPTGGRR